MISVHEGDFPAFFEAPFSCYGASLHVSMMRGDLQRSLDCKLNPLFRLHGSRTWFTAHRNGRVAGRILAHIHDASNRLHRMQRGYFGYFDCIDDREVAQNLIDAAASWLAARGCTEMAGNFNLTITQTIGVVTAGFEHRPYIYQDWNPPHIPRLLSETGFSPFFPMHTFEADLTRIDPEQVLGAKQRAMLADPDWQWLPIKRNGLTQRLLEANDCLNDGFRDNAMFVSLTEDEFLFPCDGMTWVMDETLSYTAYHRGIPVGVLLCIPDLNPFLQATRSRIGITTPWHLLRHRLTRSRAAIIFFSVKRDYQGQGVNGVLLHHLLVALKRGGYQRLGVSWVSDSNRASQRQMEKIGASPLHQLHLFRKSLTPE
jgi:GNAT superfamily N-acetyltransferase